MELPMISKAFYPDAVLIYLFPLPLFAWAVFHSARSRKSSELNLLTVTLTLSISIVFITVYIFGMNLPFIPVSVRIFTEN